MDSTTYKSNYNDCHSYNNEDKAWYVIYTKPNFEKTVSRGLQEIGFKTYVPTHNELRNWKDRKKWIEVPLFRSYVFIYTDYKSRHYAFKVQGIVKYVTIGNENAKLRDGEIEKIEQICNSNEKITIEYDKLEIGQKVLIVEGPLLGLEGYVYENGGNKRVGINIQGLNCFASVQIDSTKVKLQLT